jgi:GAF domain-containing protein
VARATLSIQDEGTLLSRLAQEISKQFGFYHVGIFLLDEQRENAVLRASNSESGRKMLIRKHSMKIGEIGIVSHVAASGNPRIALDVGADTAFVSNPDLPETRSELALPLQAAGQMIGVLDVQSTESNAFQPEDTEILSTLADQVAIAIQNARSHETTHRLLEEAQKASGAYVQESWRLLQSQEKKIGYLVSNDELRPLDKFTESARINKVIANGETQLENGVTATLAVPIRLRDEVVGVVDIRVLEEHDWDPDEVDIAEAVADRLSLALESATLLRSTQRRAEIERITADISGKISASSQFDFILRTAAEELSRVLGGSEVLVQIQPETLENTSRSIKANGQE